MKAKFHNVAIKGIATIVPPTAIDIDSTLHSIYKGDEKALARIKKVIGLQKRHIAEPHITASDMGEMAANRLLSALKIPRDSIDALLFVTQSPDYFLPATACYLHGKLGLSTHCLSLDINQACAGYLYGLYMAHSLIESNAAKRVLLIVGDTISRFVNPLDSNLAPIIGDGVSATLLELRHSAYGDFLESAADASLRRMSNTPHSLTSHNSKNSSTILECQDSNEADSCAANTRIGDSSTQDSKSAESQSHRITDSHNGFVSGFGNNEVLDSILLDSKGADSSNISRKDESPLAHYFELGSEGSKFSQLIIPQGACRIPTREIIKDSKVWETNETRTLNQLYMDGAEIFNFAVMQYPATFESIIAYAGCEKSALDYYFFHQANKYIVDNIARRLGLEKAKVPNDTTSKYGNLSGCSIPATICDTLGDIAQNGLETPLRIHLAGFGAGLSWGNAVLSLERGFYCQKVGIYES